MYLFYFSGRLLNLKKLNNVKNKSNFLKIWLKNSFIPKELVGTRVLVYNGLIFISILIRDNMVGHKFGEFIWTKKLGPSIHTRKKKGKGKGKSKKK